MAKYAKPTVSRDTIATYLIEIGDYPPLSREQETDLAKRIEERGNKILWAVFKDDPVFLVDYFVGKVSKKKSEDREVVQALFASKRKISEEDFYARVETLRNTVSFTSTYKTIVETYRQKLDQEQEQAFYCSGSDRKNYRASKTSPQKRQELEKLVSAWEEPRDLLAKHNLRFVISIAKKFASRGKMSLLDCIQEGNE
ncbi:MAG: sigma-70 factor domain-containing protein, partial [Nanoarchaeota archaeon]